MALTARDVMNPQVVTVRRDMGLKELAKLFLERGFSGAPVVDRNGDLVGVISQTDLVFHSLTRGDELIDVSHFYQTARVEGRPIPTGFQVEDTNAGTVADVMTPVVHAVGERAGLETIRRLMTRHHIHRVIVRRGRKPVGVISALDLLGALRQEAGESKTTSRSKRTRRATSSSRRRR